MNDLVNPLQVSRFLQIYDEEAAQKGIKLSIGFDFHKYLSITRTTPTKDPTTICFQPPIKSGDGFWMIGVDKNNDVAVLQAVRLYELSHTNMAEHLVKVFCPDSTPHGYPQNRYTCISPSAKKMTGKVAYHGDGWVCKSYRGQGIPKIMAGVAFGVSFAMWDPDFMCAIVPPWQVDKGVVAQYGYTHYEAGGLSVLNENVLNEHFLIWLARDELRCRVERHDKTESIPVV